MPKILDVIFKVVFPEKGTHMPHAGRWKQVFRSLQETRLAVTSGVTAYLKALGGGWKEGEKGGKERERKGASAAICV